MVKYLHKKCVQSKWLEPSEEDLDLADRGFSTLGVALRRQDRSLATEPRQLSNAFVQAVERLEVPVAFTMSSEISQSLIQQLSPYQRFVPLGDSGLTLPIVNSLKDLGVMVSRASYACVCLEERIIVLWTDNPQGILAHGSDIESLLVGAVSLHLRMLHIVCNLHRSRSPTLPFTLDSSDRLFHIIL